MYDAIIVGARCAGAPTAMLLARRGFKVLLVDKATFPSDTISTHILWPHGAELLGRWGLVQRLAGTGLPPICRPMTFDVGPFALRGTIPDANDGKGGFCPRRWCSTAFWSMPRPKPAPKCGGFAVDDLLMSDDTVVGIRGHTKGTTPSRSGLESSSAPTVNSFVARAVRARVRRSTRGRLCLLLLSVASGKTTSSCMCGTTTRLVARRPTMAFIW